MEKKKVYIYEDFSGFDIELYAEELPGSEMYDNITDESRRLLLVTSDITEMIDLFPRYGFTENTTRYQELISAFKEILDGRINSTTTDEFA